MVPNETIVKSDQSCLLIHIQDMTRIESMFVLNPNKGIIEDRVYKDNYQLGDVRHVLARIKKMLYYGRELIKLDTFIHQFEYPMFSKVCYVALMLIIYQFDPHYILSYILIILFLVTLSHSQFYQQYGSPIVKQLFFSP